MNFASSLAELRSWSEAGDVAEMLVGAEPQLFNTWIDGSLTLHLRSDGDGQQHAGNFGLVALGADYLVNDKLLAGVAFRLDTMRDEVGIASAEGQGLLVAPYVSTELLEGVYFDASVLYGRSWNKVSTGFFGGDFQTERFLAKAKLEGVWQLGEQLTLRPDATMVLSTERAGNYTVTNGLGDVITVADFTSTQLWLSAGGALQCGMVLDNGLALTPELRATAGLSALDLVGAPPPLSARLALGSRLRTMVGRSPARSIWVSMRQALSRRRVGQV